MNSEILLKYLSGSCTETEKKEVEVWLKESPKNQERMSEMKQIWKVSPSKKIYVDSYKAWDVFSEHHMKGKKKTSESTSGNSAKFTNTFKYRIRRKRNFRVINYAIAVASVLFITFMFYRSSSFPTKAPEPKLVNQEITTGKGQRTIVRLSDSTRIYLNAESRLSVPQDYMKNDRVVHLNGEAFFEVTSNKDRPFIVHTENSITQVLGTRFNVNAYLNEEEVQVVVAEGKVALSSDEDLQAPEVQLTKNQRGTINNRGEVIASNVPDVGMYTDWSRGMLTFRDAPLEDVERRLERWYDIDVIFDEGVSNENRRLTGSFKDVSMTSVLNSIALSLELNYTEDGRKITFIAR